MPKNTGEEKTYEISLAKVLREELNHIKHNKPPTGCPVSSDERIEKLNAVFKDLREQNLSALCFSGGGIRSATFGLGIVQALAKYELLDKFDYLSTVSGGGYMGSWLSAWIRREQVNKFETESFIYEKKSDDIKVIQEKLLTYEKDSKDIQGKLIIFEKRLIDIQENVSQENTNNNGEEIEKLKGEIEKLKGETADLEDKIEKSKGEIANLNQALEEYDIGLFETYQKLQDEGIKEVQKELNNQSIPVSDSDSSYPNPEPTQLQFLREYSNYLNPRVGLLSADTWTFLAIYIRNLFLNWTIFIPLIAAVLLIPRLLFAFTNLIAINERLAYLMIPISLFAGSVALAFVVNRLPSKNTDIPESKSGDADENKYNTDAHILGYGVLPPLILAFAATTLRALAMNDESLTKWTFPTGIIATSAVIVFLLNKFPNKNTDKTQHNSEGWVLGLMILPLLATAFAATTFWAWYKCSKIAFLPSFDWLRLYASYEVVNITAFMILTFLIGYLFFDITKRPKVKIDWKAGITAFISSAVGGFLMWMAAHNFFEGDFFDFEKHNYNLLLYVCIAVPVFLLIFLIAATVFVGLSSMFLTDADREWLARFGAWILIVCAAWFVLNVLVLFCPIGFGNFILTFRDFIANIGNPDSKIEFHWIDYLVSLITAISGFLSLAGGFSGKSPVKGKPTKSYLSKFLLVAPQIAAVIFSGFLLVGLAFVSSVVLASVGNFLNSNLENFTVGRAFNGATYLNVLFHQDVLYQTSIGYLFAWLTVLSAIGMVMAFFINVNTFSLHGAYRDRLVRAYLGASHVSRKSNKFTGFDDTDNFQLHRLKGQKPFHVINATLNLIDGKKLAWQNRKAASFTMSPLHCGSWLLGYRYANQYSRNRKYSRIPNLPKCEHLRYCNRFDEPCHLLDNSGNPYTDEFGKKLFGVEYCKFPGKALRLGTAMAISGAAANPNMGYYSSPIVTFLMSLFNIRLGWWLGNTGAIGDRKDRWGKEFYTKPSPSIAVLPLINETFGRTDENKRYLNITDGGHFENLGIYEMVLRRCKLIVVSDAAADENFTFGEISNAVEKCKVDLGVDIKFNEDIKIYARNTAKDFADRQYFAVAEIIYPETNQSDPKDKSYLLYIRPTYYGTEPTDIKHYANSNEKFPHQSTADQLYDEKQFEAYRALGFFTMEEIIEKTKLSDFLRNL